MSKSNFASVIKSRGFKYLWINQVLMQLAVNTLNFALILWVFKLTDSITAVSALIISFYLPALAFGIFAGVFVDLWDKRRVIIILDLLLAISIFVFAFIKPSLPLILLDSFLINTLNQFFMPAESSSIPMVVKKQSLFIANSLFSFTLYGSFMVGYTLAGPVFNLFGIDTIFYMGAGALTLAFLLAQNLPKLKPVQTELSQNLSSLLINETKKTVQFVRGKLSVATSIGLLSAMQGIIGILAVTVSPYMERVLHIHATDASLFLMLPLGLGMVTGALLVGRLFSNAPRRKVVIPGIIVAGILLFTVGVAPSLARFFNSIDLPEKIPHLRYFFNAPSLSSTFAVGAFLLGMAAVAIIIPSQTILQEATSKENRGKIFAVLGMMMNAFALVPVVLAGGLADLFGVTPIYVGLGIIVFTIGILALKPDTFFTEHSLPFSLREFLGLGHWERRGDVSKTNSAY